MSDRDLISDILIEVALDTGTEYFSMYSTSTEDAYYEGRISSIGNLNKAIRPGGGVSSIQNVKIAFDDADGYLKTKAANTTFKRREVTVKIANIASGITTVFVGRIDSYTSDAVSFEIDIKDDSWDRLQDEILLKVFPDIFPYMPRTTKVALIPIVLGTVTSTSFDSKGHIPAYLIDPHIGVSYYRYVAAQHPLKSISAVYRKGELVSSSKYDISYANVTTTEYGAVRMTFIDFDDDQRDSDEEEVLITYDATGLTDTNLEGGTLITNPATGLESFLKLRSIISADEFDDTLVTAAESAYSSASITLSAAIVNDGTTWLDVIDEFANSYNLQFFRTNSSQFGMIFDKATSGTSVETFVDSADILKGSFSTDHPSDIQSTLEFYYAKDFSRNEWRARNTYNDSAEETALGRDVRRSVQLAYLRDINQSQKMCQIKLFQNRSSRLLVEFATLPRPVLELGNVITLTHFGGEETTGAGYADKEFRILEISFEAGIGGLVQRIKAIDAPGLTLGSPSDSEPDYDDTPPPTRIGEIVSDIEFYAVDENTIGWTTGDIKNKLTGTLYEDIITSNTGNMTNKTWIYFDPSVSTSSLQVASTLATAAAGYIMCICYPASSGYASFHVVVGFARTTSQGGTTTTTQSVDSSDQIRDGVVLPAHITATTLAAISATLGSVTVTSGQGITVQSGGDINLNAGGDINLTPSDTDPSQINFGSDAAIYNEVTVPGLYIMPLDAAKNLFLADPSGSYGWNSVVVYTKGTTPAVDIYSVYSLDTERYVYQQFTQLTSGATQRWWAYVQYSSGIYGQIKIETNSSESQILIESDKLGFFGATPIVKPSAGDLAGLLTALENLGLIMDTS